jgi:hypothetical protein
MKTNKIMRPTFEQTNVMMRTMLEIIHDLKERADPKVRESVCGWEAHFDATIENVSHQYFLYVCANCSPRRALWH